MEMILNAIFVVLLPGGFVGFVGVMLYFMKRYWDHHDKAALK